MSRHTSELQRGCVCIRAWSALICRFLNLEFLVRPYAVHWATLSDRRFNVWLQLRANGLSFELLESRTDSALESSSKMEKPLRMFA